MSMIKNRNNLNYRDIQGLIRFEWSRCFCWCPARKLGFFGGVFCWKSDNLRFRATMIIGRDHWSPIKIQTFDRIGIMQLLKTWASWFVTVFWLLSSDSFIEVSLSLVGQTALWNSPLTNKSSNPHPHSLSILTFSMVFPKASEIPDLRKLRILLKSLMWY